MNKVFFVVLFLSLAHLATAQGENHFNAGVGLDSWGIPIYGSYDWHFADDFNLGAGGILNLGSSSNDEFDGSSLGLGFFTQWYADRVAAIPSDFDAYAGLGLYYFLYDGGGDLDFNPISVGSFLPFCFSRHAMPFTWESVRTISVKIRRVRDKSSFFLKAVDF